MDDANEVAIETDDCDHADPKLRLAYVDALYGVFILECDCGCEVERPMEGGR